VIDITQDACLQLAFHGLGIALETKMLRRHQQLAGTVPRLDLLVSRSADIASINSADAADAAKSSFAAVWMPVSSSTATAPISPAPWLMLAGSAR
jgi:hypothetical protein